MADRVLFATNEVPGIPAASSGFNGLPFPTPVPPGGQTGDGKQWPFACTLAELIQLIWRCKVFRVSTGPINWAGGTQIFSAVTGDIGHLATRERDIILNYPRDDGGAWNEQAGGPQSYVYFQAFLRFLTAEDGDPAYKDGDDFYPNFVAGISIVERDEQTPDPSAFGGNAFTSTYDIFEDGLTAGTLTLVANGISIAMPLYKIGSDYATDMTVECIEWWPYADSEDDPVYNTSTGAQLTDPLG